MKLKLFPDAIVLCKLHDSTDVSQWLDPDSPLHVTIKDPHGKTVICRDSFTVGREAEIVDQSNWRFFQIDEVFEIDSIGVVAEFSQRLAAENISVFVISSYETDYLLVQPHATKRATEVFEQAGHQVTTTT